MNADAEPSASGAPTSDPSQPPGRLVARFLSPARRRALHAALQAGRARQIAAVELLAPERLGDLARDSLLLLLLGGISFGALEALAWAVRHGGLTPGNAGFGWQLTAVIVGNLVLYLAVLPLHEAVHAAVIVALGGSPQLGLRLPLALYCTAPGQLFTRAGYAAVALSPLILLSLAGGVVIWLAPGIGAYLLLALAGNVSGAVGDLTTFKTLRALPPDALIADQATGYAAYTVAML
jgi:hypothetical protein